MERPPDAGVTPGDHMRDVDKDADCFSPENIRPAPQNIRYAGFPGQQAPQRNTPLGSGRLHNTTKLGRFLK